jgi:hypothetical protein
MLEQLFKKVQNQYGVDKVKLIKSLLDTTGHGSKNILQGLTKKEGDSNKDEHSIDQFSGGVDFLMDENILTNESREESDSQNLRTPGGHKSMNTNSINAINSAGFSNQQAMKKMKGSSKILNNAKTNPASST